MSNVFIIHILIDGSYLGIFSLQQYIWFYTSLSNKVFSGILTVVHLTFYYSHSYTSYYIISFIDI